MEKNEDYQNENAKAKAVGGWAKAVENVAKAAIAVVGLAVCIILGSKK